MIKNLLSVIEFPEPVHAIYVVSSAVHSSDGPIGDQRLYWSPVFFI